MNEISRLGHYCLVNRVKPSDLNKNLIKRICAGEFDPPCIGRSPTFETIPYKEWQEMLKTAKHIPESMLKFPNKPSGPTKDARFDEDVITDTEEYLLNVFNKTKYAWMKELGLIIMGFILGWLVYG